MNTPCETGQHEQGRQLNNPSVVGEAYVCSKCGWPYNNTTGETLSAKVSEDPVVIDPSL